MKKGEICTLNAKYKSYLFSAPFKHILWVNVFLHMKGKTKKWEGGPNFYSKSYPRPTFLRIVSNMSTGCWWWQLSDAPGFSWIAVARGLSQITSQSRVTGPSRSKKYWPHCKCAGSQEMATPSDQLLSIIQTYLNVASEPKAVHLSQVTPYSFLDLHRLTLLPQKKKKILRVWHQHVSLS